ncbi:MAG: hypothetical protein ACYSSO_03650 [Planctomycetota bacterium]|jgi:hypothetical protein
MYVSCFQEGSKKNFEKMDFWFQVYAHLIEKSPLAPRAQAAGGFGMVIDGQLGWGYNFGVAQEDLLQVVFCVVSTRKL